MRYELQIRLHYDCVLVSAVPPASTGNVVIVGQIVLQLRHLIFETPYDYSKILTGAQNRSGATKVLTDIPAVKSRSTFRTCI